MVVTVSKGQNQPYTYRGKAWRRVVNTSQAMSRDQYNQVLLERLHGERRWENEPAPGWGVDDLERQRAILSLLAGAPTGYALREIIPRLGDSPAERQVRDDLRILRTLGLAVCEGHGRGARWKRQ